MNQRDGNNLEQSGNWSNERYKAHSIAGRARVREQLQQDIEAFLSEGGRIEEVETTFCAVPSRKVEVGFSGYSF